MATPEGLLDPVSTPVPGPSVAAPATMWESFQAYPSSRERLSALSKEGTVRFL